MAASSPQAVIFDLDGTLADTLGDLGGAVNAVLAAHGFPEHPLSDLRSMVGRGFAAMMRQALPLEASQNEGLFEVLLAEAIELYSRRALDTSRPYPGIPELLSALRHKNILLAVLSNKPDAIAKAMVAGLFPDTAFIAAWGNREGMPRKPDPAAALAIAELSGLPPRSWAFVGDSGVDMKTGKAGGMLPLGASWGYRTVEELKENGAAGILASPADLLLYL